MTTEMKLGLKACGIVSALALVGVVALLNTGKPATANTKPSQTKPATSSGKLSANDFADDYTDAKWVGKQVTLTEKHMGTGFVYNHGDDGGAAVMGDNRVECRYTKSERKAFREISAVMKRDNEVTITGTCVGKKVDSSGRDMVIVLENCRLHN